MTAVDVRVPAQPGPADDDLEFFRETTARFLADRTPVEELRRLRTDPRGAAPDYWRQAAELGWTSLLVAEEHGGGSISGSGLADLAVVARELGRRAAPGPLVATNLVATALSRSGTHLDVLAGLLDGSSTASWALSEPGRAGHTAGLAARRDGSDLVLSGVKRPVEAAVQAEHLLVVCRVDGRLTQVLVPTDAPGVTVTPLQTVDLTRRCGSVVLDDVRVPADAVLGGVGEAEAEVTHLLDTALVLLVAEQVGTLDTVFDMTLQWSSDRYSFGRPLAGYQAVKHRFADMKAMLEASRAILGEATAAVAAGDPQASSLASAAKAYVGDAGSHLLQEGVHLHGGLGVTFEHDVHLYLRRHTLDRALLGTPGDHRQRLTDLAEQAAQQQEAHA